MLPPRAINPARLIDGFMSVFQLGAPETCELRRRIPPPGTGAVRWGHCSRPRYKIPADRRCVSVPSFGIPETHEPQRRIPLPGAGAVRWGYLLPPRKSRRVDCLCLYPHLEFPKRMNPGDASCCRVPAPSGGGTCFRPANLGESIVCVCTLIWNSRNA